MIPDHTPPHDQPSYFLVKGQGGEPGLNNVLGFDLACHAPYMMLMSIIQEYYLIIMLHVYETYLNESQYLNQSVIFVLG